MIDRQALYELRAAAIRMRRLGDLDLWPLADFVERALLDPAKPVAFLPEQTPLTKFRIADVLQDLASETGDNRIRHAARVLMAEGSGRPPIDDQEAMHEVRRLMGQGSPQAIALATVARRLPRSGVDTKSVIRRLRRKLNGSG